MTNIMVTGCNGFIGRALCCRLLDEGYGVVGVSKEPLSPIMGEGFQYEGIDLIDSPSVVAVFEKYSIDALIHLAAIAHEQKGERQTWDSLFHVNVIASRSVFQEALVRGIPVFFSSTVDVYGHEMDYADELGENTQARPLSAYGRSKLMAERVLEQLASKYSREFAIVRFAPVYADGKMGDVYKRIYLKFPNIAYRLSCGQKYHLTSLPLALDFIIAWCESSFPQIGIVNICDDELTDADALLLAERKSGRARIIVTFPRFLIHCAIGALSWLSGLTASEKVQKLLLAAYKVARPQRYSTTRMKAFMQLRKNAGDSHFSALCDMVSENRSGLIGGKCCSSWEVPE